MGVSREPFPYQTHAFVYGRVCVQQSEGCLAVVQGRLGNAAKGELDQASPILGRGAGEVGDARTKGRFLSGQPGNIPSRHSGRQSELLERWWVPES